MSYEKEIKILNISVEDAESKLKNLGATFKGKNRQKIYTYDLPTIGHRFKEIIDQLEKAPGVLIEKSYRQRLKNLFIEVEDLLPDELVQPVMNSYGKTTLDEIVDMIDDVATIKNLPIASQILELGINPNKWIRLRRTGDKSTLTVKHVFDKNTSAIQKVGEYEIPVNSVEETDALLTALGFAKRNVQEKIRTQYEYKGAEIDIDQWPHLEPYMEIESEDESIYDELIDKCDYRGMEIVSCNTEELYRRKGIKIKEGPELLFDKDL